ncbi:MliC family protein [Pseudomonas sp. NPDC079086]|uniref:MliC family protein n=1 Tax=unclassified Pseudomonas TaxID=196821 RepID=UPI0037C7520D
MFTLKRFVLLALLGLPLATLQAAEPSFSCTKVASGSIEELICQTPALAEFDQKMASVYQQASAKAANQHPPVLKAEQRGWIKGRNDCWKAADREQCVTESYRLRITELQARYALLKAVGPVHFQCDGLPAKEVIVTYYPSEPATLLAEFADSVSLMYQQPATSGRKYQGCNESFWEHQGEAAVVWGYGSPEMKCQAK